MSTCTGGMYSFVVIDENEKEPRILLDRYANEDYSPYETVELPQLQSKIGALELKDEIMTWATVHPDYRQTCVMMPTRSRSYVYVLSGVHFDRPKKVAKLVNETLYPPSEQPHEVVAAWGANPAQMCYPRTRASVEWVRCSHLTGGDMVMDADTEAFMKSIERAGYIPKIFTKPSVMY